MFGLKIFKYLLKIPTLILIVAFVVLNRQDTTLYFSPLMDPITLPLWIMGLSFFAIGFIVGAILLWLNSWPIRKELKQSKKDFQTLEKEHTNLSNSLQDKYIESLGLPDDDIKS